MRKSIEKILFVYPRHDFWVQEGNAIFRCLEVMVSELKKYGVECSAFSTTEDLESVGDTNGQYGFAKIYRLPSLAARSNFYKKNIIEKSKRRIIFAIYLRLLRFCFPDGGVSLKWEFGYTKKFFKELVEKEQYDAVIFVGCPLWYVEFFLWIKKVGANFLSIYLLFDPFADNISWSKRKIRILQRQIIEDIVFKNSDLIISLPEIVKNAKYSHISRHKNKLLEIPSPNLYSGYHKQKRVDKISKKEHIVCVYMGEFYADIRNPQFMLDMFVHLPSNFELHLYFSGCEKIVDSYKKPLEGRLFLHKRVNPEQATNIMNDANILISIGNKTINQTPSKIFSYMATGLPIVNFYSNINDSAKYYLDNYPLSLSVPENDESLSASGIEKLVHFMKKNYNTKLSYEEATRNLEKYRASSVANSIYNRIQMMLQE